LKSRLLMLMSVAVAALSLVLAAGHLTYTIQIPKPAHASLKPQLSSYLGVYEPGFPSTYGPMGGFESVAGRLPNLAAYYSGWAEPFKTAFAELLHQHHIVPLVQIDPTDALVDQVAAGTYDDYLRAYADAVRDFGHPVVIGFGHEMNASWYSWGYRRGVSPATFVAAWRHLVQVFRGEGADNVTWLWTIQADQPGTGPIQDWWPGKDYVTWVGIDGFLVTPKDSFEQTFGPTIAQVRSFTRSPVLLSETAVGPRAGQFAGIKGLFDGMATARTLGLVWFDAHQNQGVDHQDWRLEDSQIAGFSFRLGIKDDLTANPLAGS
jgi:mannan endo-1,4-beta-mannosidase